MELVVERARFLVVLAVSHAILAGVLGPGDQRATVWAQSDRRLERLHTWCTHRLRWTKAAGGLAPCGIHDKGGRFESRYWCAGPGEPCGELDPSTVDSELELLKAISRIAFVLVYLQFGRIVIFR